jgi:hypothetical protein
MKIVPKNKILFYKINLFIKSINSLKSIFIFKKPDNCFSTLGAMLGMPNPQWIMK